MRINWKNPFSSLSSAAPSRAQPTTASVRQEANQLAALWHFLTKHNADEVAHGLTNSPYPRNDRRLITGCAEALQYNGRFWRIRLWTDDTPIPEEDVQSTGSKIEAWVHCLKRFAREAGISLLLTEQIPSASLPTPSNDKAEGMTCVYCRADTTPDSLRQPAKEVPSKDRHPDEPPPKYTEFEESLAHRLLHQPLTTRQQKIYTSMLSPGVSRR